MSFIIPKKPQILYAPMLGSLGGGSVRGFGRGVGGSFFAYDFTNHTFTNASATGRYGPTLAACQNAYSGTVWANNSNWFKMTLQGTQQWVVPEAGTYEIKCAGAQGSNTVARSPSYGGYGAIAEGNFSFKGGEFLNIIVGQKGVSHQGGSPVSGGGGGGSFVWLADDQTDCLVAAGGGGGQTDNAATDSRHNNFHATRNSQGKTGSSDAHNNGRPGAEGGITGYGGSTANESGSFDTAGAGGGFFTSGETWGTAPSNVWGIAAISGGYGGAAGLNVNARNDSGGVSTREGGFGGGGGGESWYGCSGAGGGYSGGGSGADDDRTCGGGGGSYVSTALGGTNVVITDYYNYGSGGSNQNHGYVTITKV